MSLANRLLDETTHEAQFLTLLPKLKRTAYSLCQRLDPEARDEAVAEVVANAFLAYSRLKDQGRAEVVTAGSLARFGVRQFFAGRRVGSRLNSHDLLSPYARRQRGFRVERLDRQDDRGGWREILVEDRNATPADLAASRIDVANWLESLPQRIRAIALKLAEGYSTSEVARHFRISAGRVSQVRKELAKLWQEFHELPGHAPGGLAAV